MINNLFKNAISDEHACWREQYPDEPITEADLNDIIRRAWEAVVSKPDAIRSGWKRSHFFPFDMGEFQLPGAGLAVLHNPNAHVDLSKEPALKHCHQTVIDAFVRSHVDPQQQHLRQQEIQVLRKQHFPLDRSHGIIVQKEQVKLLQTKARETVRG